MCSFRPPGSEASSSTKGLTVPPTGEPGETVPNERLMRGTERFVMTVSSAACFTAGLWEALRSVCTSWCGECRREQLDLKWLAMCRGLTGIHFFKALFEILLGSVQSQIVLVLNVSHIILYMLCYFVWRDSVVGSSFILTLMFSVFAS